MKTDRIINQNLLKKPLTKRASRLESSLTGPEILRMQYNESPYGVPPKALQAGMEIIKDCNTYQDWAALDLKQTLANYHGVKVSNVLPAAGSSPLIDMIGHIFLNPGEEVIFGDPTFEAFRDMAYDHGGVPVPVALKDFYFDLEAIEQAINDKTKIIVITNPNNPTGTRLPSSKIEAFIKKVPENIIVVVDEAYLDFSEGDDCYSMIKLIQEGYDKPLIILRTYSKIYGMASIRVGYAICHEDIIEQLSKSAHGWNVSKVGQNMAIAAIKDQEFINDVKAKIIASRKYVTEKMKQMGIEVVDSQTNFIYFKTKLEPALLTKRLDEYNIKIGTFKYNRVTLGTEAMNDKFLAALKEILE